jgi:hypothetical protein
MFAEAIELKIFIPKILIQYDIKITQVIIGLFKTVFKLEK